MSDQDYEKWKKKNIQLPLWIKKIIDHPNPSREFCIKVYNEKSRGEDDE